MGIHPIATLERRRRMIVYPAIDIRGGRCVRLRQGDYSQETVFGDDPAAMARRWVDEGSSVLHLVDLDGAKSGHPVNGEAIKRIVESCSVPCQLGGGIRSDDHLREVFAWGVARVVIGSRAVQDPAWLRQVAFDYPGKIVLGIDAKEGRVATEGWLHVSEVSAVDLAKQCEDWPLAGVVYTDIARDGMMMGPNFDAQAEMAAATKLPVIASGGVTSAEHVLTLRKHGLAGVIVGRALYEGGLKLTEVLQSLSGERRLTSGDG